MKINIRTAKNGEQTFFLQPFVKQESNTEGLYILIRNMKEINQPPITLKLNNKTKTFLKTTNCDIDEPDSYINEKLNNLAIELLEALQQGKDITAEDIPEEEQTANPYDPDKIRVETSSMSLRQVNDMITDNDINLSPDFQRNSIWDEQRKCRLIESILLRIPLPVFYFSADINGRLSVVDGLQRLTAIKEFMNNKLPLHGLEYLSECEGCTYNGTKKLDDRLYRRFNLTQITTNVIDSSSPTKVKYDIFRRLNTGGRPLNAQELRNCLSSNKLREALKTMAHGEPFRNATTNSISDDRMDAQECALRFIYFRKMYTENDKNIESYSGFMDYDLDSFVDEISHTEDFPFSKYIDEYNKAMINASFLFGRHAFRKVSNKTIYDDDRSVINKALFLSISVILADYSSMDIESKCEKHSMVSSLGQLISNDKYLFSMLSYGTNGWKNLIYTFGVMKNMISNELNESRL